MPLVSQIASDWWRRMLFEDMWDKEELENLLRSELDSDTEDLRNTSDDEPSDEVEIMLDWIERERDGLIF